jgi:hypothetical protein
MEVGRRRPIMRTAPALRTLAAALLTSGALAVGTAGTTAAAAPPTSAQGRGSVGSTGDPVLVTLAHETALTVRQASAAGSVPSGDWEFTFSSAWSVSVSGTSSGGWEWIPLAR